MSAEFVSQIEERARVEGTLRQMQRLEAVGQLKAGPVRQCDLYAIGPDKLCAGNERPWC